QDLHDDLGQRLAGLAMLAHALRVDLEAESQPHAVKAARLTEVANETMIAARALAKSFYPVELERHGFNIATEDLAKGLEIIAGVECETRFDSEFHVGQDAAIHLYRIVQESMTNAVKHGRARRIVISGSARKGTSSLEITDNGIGFQMPAQGASSGIGLHLLGYRARLIGATLEIERASAEGGCRVKCVWECVAENAQDMARESR
ncbi:MAG: ATP-binding protein, partial [Luteolibacter sp.]